MPTGKTIVITGAGSGLGEAWTHGFLADGARVIAADLNTSKFAELEALGALTIRTDVSVEAEVQAMVDFAVRETGRIDVLFNNAGIGMNRPFMDIPAGEFEQHVAVHLYGAVYGMRAALPHMEAQGFGRIINTISRAAEVAGARNAAYAAAKAAMWATSKSVAAEYQAGDILINMLIPGPTNTAIWGRDMPNMQTAEVTYPTAKMLATLPADGPRGKVFWDEKEYPLFKALYS
ncbi:MAG: SDR family NAD(P)-dependent oxidoreductase [Pseudomonadota bacterium]